MTAYLYEQDSGSRCGMSNQGESYKKRAGNVGQEFELYWNDTMSKDEYHIIYKSGSQRMCNDRQFPDGMITYIMVQFFALC